MSLIPVPSSQNWVVVLKDSTRKSLVFYNQASHALALVNDPREFSLYEQYEAQDNSSVNNWESGSSADGLYSNKLVTYYSNGSLPSSSSSAAANQQSLLVSSDRSQLPEYYNRYPEYEEFNQNYTRFNEYRSPTTGSAVMCPECGTFVPSARLRRGSRNSRTNHPVFDLHHSSSHRHPHPHRHNHNNHNNNPNQQPRRQSPHNNSSPNNRPQQKQDPIYEPMETEIVRDASYFRLLEGFTSIDEQKNEHSDPDPKSSPSSSTNPILSPSSSTISTSALSEGYFARFFRVVGYLGRGSRGYVYLVEHLLDGYSLGLFALKKVPVGDDHKWLEKVLTEVNLLRLLSHPNLVNYNHMWLENAQMSRFSPKVPCAFILQEYCDGGTLEDYVNNLQTEARIEKMKKEMSKKSLGKGKTALSSAQAKREKYKRATLDHEASGGGGNNGLDETSTNEGSRAAELEIIPEARLTVREILTFSKDIFAGVSHLHRARIIHRDLKPSNCLLLSAGKRGASDMPQSASSMPNVFNDMDTGSASLGDNSSVPGVKSSPIPTYEERLHGTLPTILVSDFGEGQREGILRAGTGATGTLEYCAPELIGENATGSNQGSDSKNPSSDSGSGNGSSNKQKPVFAQFSRKTDMFSLGMILHFLIYSRLPYPSTIIDNEDDPNSVTKLRAAVSEFNGFSESNLLDANKRDDIPSELLEVLTRLLSRTSQDRPEAEECVVIIERLLQNMAGEQETERDANLDNDEAILDDNEFPGSTNDSNTLKPQPPKSRRASIRLISDISIADAQYSQYYPVYTESFFVQDDQSISQDLLESPDPGAFNFEIGPSEANKSMVPRNATISSPYNAEDMIPATTSSAMVPFDNLIGVPSIEGSSLQQFGLESREIPSEPFGNGPPPPPPTSEYELFKTNSGSQIQEIEDENEILSNQQGSSFLIRTTPGSLNFDSRDELPRGLVPRITKRKQKKHGVGINPSNNSSSSSLVAQAWNKQALKGLLQGKYRNAILPQSASIIGHSVPSDSGRVSSVTVSRQSSQTPFFGKDGLSSSSKQEKQKEKKEKDVGDSEETENQDMLRGTKRTLEKEEEEEEVDNEGIEGNRNEGFGLGLGGHLSDGEGSKRQKTVKNEVRKLKGNSQRGGNGHSKLGGNGNDNNDHFSFTSSAIGFPEKKHDTASEKSLTPFVSRHRGQHIPHPLFSPRWEWRAILLKGVLFMLKAYSLGIDHRMFLSILGINKKGVLGGLPPNLSSSRSSLHGENMLTRGATLSPAITHLLILLSGIELPINNVKATVVFFLIHVGLVFGSKRQ